MNKAGYKADAILLLAAAIWGSGFVAQRLGMEHVGPMTFNAVRFAIGTLILLPFIHFRSSCSGSPVSASLRLYAFGGGVAGFVLFIAASLQQMGLEFTTAGKGGFITGLYVILVPIIGLFRGRRAGSATWVGAVFAVAGMYFLSVTDEFSMNRGDWLVLASAVFWALHVLTIGVFAPKTSPLRLAAVQFAVVCILSTVAALVTETITMQSLLAAKWAIIYGGVFSIGIAFTLQVVAQQHAPPAHAVIILSLEAVFAALCGWLVMQETFTGRQLVGCAFMLGGMLIAQARKPRPQLPVP